MENRQVIIFQGNRFGKLADMEKMVKDALARKEEGGGRRDILIVDYSRTFDIKKAQCKTSH